MGMLKITCLGDMMCDAGMSERLEDYRDSGTGKMEFHPVFVPIKSMLHDSDYVLANLETPISRTSTNLTFKQYEFCSAFEFAQAIKDCGIDYVSTANNHCLDRGIEGVRDTVKSLDELGLVHSGIQPPEVRREPLVVSVDGVKFGLLSYTYGTNAVTNRQYLGFKNRRTVDLLQEQEGAFDRIDLWKRYARHHPSSLMAKLRFRWDALWHPGEERMDWFEKTTWGGIEGG